MKRDSQGWKKARCSGRNDFCRAVPAMEGETVVPPSPSRLLLFSGDQEKKKKQKKKVFHKALPANTALPSPNVEDQ